MSETKTGTIYKISTPKSEKVYVGSTVQALKNRMFSHKSNRKCSCYELIQLGECKIEALEVLYNCTKKELEIKEQFYLDLLKDKAVNKKRAHHTDQDKKKDNCKKSLKCYHKKMEDPEYRKQKAEEAKLRRDKQREARLAKNENPESC